MEKCMRLKALTSNELYNVSAAREEQKRGFRAPFIRIGFYAYW